MAPAMHQSPAAYTIALFGGIRPLARELDVDPSTVFRWKEPVDRGGSAGLIPSSIQSRLLTLAKSQGLDLTAEDLIHGREVVA